MSLQSNLRHLSKKKNNEWGKHAARLISCYQENNPGNITKPMRALNAIFQENNLKTIPEEAFFSEYKAWIRATLGKY